MSIAIIASSKDPAGINIRNNLVELFDFEKADEKFDNNDNYECIIKDNLVKLYLINDDLIFSDNIDKKIDADIFIFASKHRSKKNTQSFAVHPIGNWGKAEFGGQERKLCFSSAFLLKNMFLEVNNAAKGSAYEITMEATHHGPYIDKPAVFAEIGSTEKEWNASENGEVIAKAIINSLKKQNESCKTAIGIGGPHYCSNFNKILLRTDIAVSHICPKYHLEKLDQELIKQAVEKTQEKVDFILLDWKGLGTEKQRIVDLIKNMNLEYRRTDQILN